MASGPKRLFLSSERGEGTTSKYFVLVSSFFSDPEEARKQVEGIKVTMLSKPFTPRQKTTGRQRSLSFVGAHSSARRQIRTLLARLEMVSAVRYASTNDVDRADDRSWYYSMLKQFAVAELRRDAVCELQVPGSTNVDVDRVVSQLESLARTLARREQASAPPRVPFGKRVNIRVVDSDDACCVLSDHVARRLRQMSRGSRTPLLSISKLRLASAWSET
jgi:hypothetical protein